jgi:hypothetical protein
LKHITQEELQVKKRVSQIVMVLFICVPIGLVVALYLRSEAKEKRAQEAELAKTQAQEKNVEDSIARLAFKHNAVGDWYKPIPKGRTTETLYTADLMPLLVRPDGRPILFLGEIKDVSINGDEYLLTIKTEGFGSFPRIDWLLETNAELAKQILDAKKQKGERYAIVANIVALQKGEQIAHSEEDNGSYPEAVFSARGQCVDIMPVGQYLGDILTHLQDSYDKR